MALPKSELFIDDSSIAELVNDQLESMFSDARQFLPNTTNPIPIFLLETAGMRNLEKTYLEVYKSLRNAIKECTRIARFKIQERNIFSTDGEVLPERVAVSYSYHLDILCPFLENYNMEPKKCKILHLPLSNYSVN